MTANAYQRLLERCDGLDFDDMRPADYAAFVDALPQDEFMALLAMHDQYRNGAGDPDGPIESAWLIEREDSSPDRPLYYSPSDHGGQWTQDEDAALHMAREIDASRLAHALAVRCRVVERVFA